MVLPNDIDDPATPSGGNSYDRQLCCGLAAAGWTVHEHPVSGAWPLPGSVERDRLARLLAALPAGGLVLLDGLVACCVPEVLVPQADRLRLVVLVHMALEDADERAALACARAVLSTSGWTRRRLLEQHRLPGDRVHVATPGVVAADRPEPTPGGTRLLCVAAVSRHKGHDLLVRALAGVAELPWTCLCIGSLTREPGFVAELRAAVRDAGLAGRFSLAGALTGGALAAGYAADLLVLASRGETYGMVVTEALARGIPVLATDVGGVSEALGGSPDGPPGLLVPAEDPLALAEALRHWLTDPVLRRRLRAAARARRAGLDGWPVTVRRVSSVLAAVA